MKEYSVDVGSWERGRTHRIYAKTPEQVHDLALKYCAMPNSDEKIVYIHEVIDGRRKCVYDYMNGFGIYQGSNDASEDMH